MEQHDPKYWLRAARAMVRTGTKQSFIELREKIAAMLDRGESIRDVVAAWDSLERNPNDSPAAGALFLALDLATSRARSQKGTVVGLGLLFTIQFKNDVSLQREDTVGLDQETVQWVTGRIFATSAGKPVFSHNLLQHLQVEVAGLMPERLGRHFRKDVVQAQTEFDPSSTFVAPYPDGIVHTVQSGTDPARPYVVVSAFLPGFLSFDTDKGAEEIENIWMGSGQLSAMLDFTFLDEISARVHADLAQRFPSIISTKMGSSPLRFMSAGNVSHSPRPHRVQQKSALRNAGYF